MSHYNVLEEPWIPVIDLDGKRKMLGIMDTLAQAHQIKEISDTIPSYEYGVFRFLCAFLMDVYRPEEWGSIQDLYDQKSFDMGTIQDYIECCKKEGVSFDLFDKKRFCTAGVQGYPSTINGAPPIYFVYEGANLFESLVYSMVAVEEGGEISYDVPPVIWRNLSDVIPKQTETSISVLYGMLYPCRRVLLYPEEDGTVKKIYLCQGKNFVAYDSWKDPHVSYLYSDKGRSSLKPTMEKEPWRNITTIFSDDVTAPVFIHRVLNENLVDEVFVTAYSIVTNKANYLDMQKSHLKMPRSIAMNETKRDRVQEIIKAVEEMNHALGKSINGCFIAVQQDKSNKVNHRIVSDVQSKFLQQCRDYILQEVFNEMAIVLEKDASACTDKFLDKLGKDCISLFDMVADSFFSSSRELRERQKMRGLLNYRISQARKEEKNE